MQLYTVDPLQDSRWDALVASHSQASAFHHRGWLKALATTYGYRPVVFTTTPPDMPLWDGLVFCEVESWITGRRLVSLPFADHADPLLNQRVEGIKMEDWAPVECHAHRWKYIEFRPLSERIQPASPLRESRVFWFHSLCLAPSIDRMFAKLHKSCFQRRIQHAERERMTYERGDSDALLDAFYRLMVATRKRQGLIPQPRAWFRNLITSLRPNAEIRLLRKDGAPVAAIFTLRHRRINVFKYGCSDEGFHHLGGMPLLFWNLIVESKTEGAEQIDFGRTDVDNEGLIQFKDRLGAIRRKINYFRYSEARKQGDLVARCLPVSKNLFAALPQALSPIVGNLVYRHIA